MSFTLNNLNKSTTKSLVVAVVSKTIVVFAPLEMEVIKRVMQRGLSTTLRWIRTIPHIIIIELIVERGWYGTQVA